MAKRGGFPGGGGMPGNMANLMKQAQKMQQDMQEKQAELEAREYDIQAGGGVVKLKINGKRQILSIDIDPEIVDPDDIETLQDLLVAAMNEAIKTVDNINSEEMGKVTQGLNMPGLF